MNCPNKNTQEWKEMVEALGEDLSYYIWNENNGYPIHLASNGKPSKLFNDLLELNNGDRTKTIQEKARVYSKEFKDNYKGNYDENKEPILSELQKYKENKIGKFSKESDNIYYSKSTNNQVDKEQKERLNNYINQEILEGEENNNLQNVLEIISEQNHILSPLAKKLLDLFEKNDMNISVQLDESKKKNKDYAGFFYDEKNGKAIVLNPDNIEDIDHLYHVILHESIHYATVRLLKSNEKLAKQWKEFFENVKEQFSVEEQEIISGLEDEMEFISELFSNIEFQAQLKDREPIKDFSVVGLWEEIVNFIRKILGINKEHTTLLEQAIDLGSYIIENGVYYAENDEYATNEQYNLNKKMTYKDKLFDSVNELVRTSEGYYRTKLHRKTEKEYQNLKKKAAILNKNQKIGIVWVGTHVGESKGKKPREFLGLRYRPYDEIERIRFALKAPYTVNNESQYVSWGTYLATDKNLQYMQEQIRKIKNDYPRKKIEIVKINNRYDYVISKNYKFIDNLIATIKNYDIDISQFYINEQYKEYPQYKYMVSKLGYDNTLKILQLTNTFLTKQEVDEYLSKVDDYKPEDNYDDRFKDTDNMTDYAMEYNEEEENNLPIDTETENIITDIMSDINPNELKEQNVDNVGDILYDLISNFQYKLRERLRLEENKLDKTYNKKERKKIGMTIKRLKSMIYNVSKEQTNIWTMMGEIDNDIKMLNNKLANDEVKENEIAYYHDLLDYWKEVLEDYRKNDEYIFHDYLKNNIPFQNASIRYIGVINELKQQLLELDKTVYLNSVNNIMNKKLEIENLNKITEISKAKSEFLDLSRTGNLLVDSIYKLLNRAEQTKMKRFNDFNDKFIQLINKMKEAGFDLSKKEVQNMFFEFDEFGNNLGILIDRFDTNFHLELKKLEKLRKRIEFSKKNYYKQLQQVNEMEDNLFNYIDLTKLLDDNGELDEKKLEAMRKPLTNRYDEHYVDKIIKEVKNKWEQFKQDSLGVREWIYDLVMTDEKYEWVRVKGENETDKDVQTRIQIEVDSMYKRWYIRNNPLTYIENKKNKNLEKSIGYKYITFLPKEEHRNEKFEQIRNNKTLFDFWVFYRESLNQFREYLPEQYKENLGDNFLPQVSKDVFEDMKLLNNVIGKIAEQTKENMTVSKSTTLKKLDSIGRELLSIPIRYLSQSPFDIEQQLENLKKEIDSIENQIRMLEQQGKSKDAQPLVDKLNQKLKYYQDKIEQKERISKQMSTDLVKILKSFAIMAENYRAYNQVEDLVNTGKRIVDNITEVELRQKSLQFGKNSKHNTIKQGAEHLKKQLDYTIKAMMYQEKKEHQLLTDKWIFKDKELQKKYNVLRKKYKKAYNDYTLNKIGKVEYMSQIDNILQQMEQLTRFEQPRVLTVDTVSDFLMQTVGITQLGWNVKSAINNYIFGKISILMHAKGGEDFTLNELKQAFKIMNKAMRLIGKNSQLNRKIDKLSSLYNVVFEVNEAAYGAKTALAEKTKPLDIFKSYGGTRKGEWYLQNAGLVALMLHNKIKVKNKINGKAYEISLWDAYTSEGKFRTDLLYYNKDTEQYETQPVDYDDSIDVKEANEYTRLRERIEQINKMIHGNYDPRSPMMIKSKWWGRLLMQYKTWMPEGFAMRFEEEIWDDMMGRYRKGRYRTIFDVGLGNSIKILSKSFFKNQMQQSDFQKDVDYRNMLKNLSELRFAVTIAMGHLALMIIVHSIGGGDTDEYKIRMLKTLLNQLRRLDQDLSFYMTPGNVLETGKNLFPTVQYLNKWRRWILSSRKLFMPGYYNEDYKFTDWLWTGASNVPIINEFKKWQREAKKIMD